MSDKIAVFQDRSIRRMMVDGVWYFSVIDVVAALTDSVNPRDYWFKMKQRVHSEDGIELSTICRQLKLESSDGKKYATDCADVNLKIIRHKVPYKIPPSAGCRGV